MNNFHIVFESPKEWHKWFIEYYLNRGFKIWVIEPFHAYHHEKGIRFFPKNLPKYIYELIENKKIKLLKARDLHAKEIYLIAADKAVEVVEKIYPEYRKAHYPIIKYMCDIVNSSTAENIFKKQLCDRLAVFYSVNIMLDKIEQVFSNDNIKVYLEANAVTYSYFKKLLIQSNQQVYCHKNIIFSSSIYMCSLYESIKNNFMIIIKLFAQITLNSLLMWKKNSFSSAQIKSYKYGVAIISPARQLAHNGRGPDFIVDNKNIHDRDMIYFPLCTLNEEQKNRLRKLKSDIFYPFNKYNVSSHILEWVWFFWIFLRYEYFKKASFVNEAYAVLVEYFRWQEIMTKVKIKHFVTHCDFGIQHIARNIALKQSGVQTWYFTDSMNFMINLAQSEYNKDKRHPFWTYLYYNHFVTWSRLLSDYFGSHPETFENHHIIGCLWADNINGLAEPKKEGNNNKFTIAAYDSTFSRNGITSYDEGIAFAQHLLKLADECPDIEIILKEKKTRSIHFKLDPILGPMLLALYDEMATRSNVKIYKDYEDASALMSNSNLVISFPFTSSTFEALSANKPAIWHDPLGYYRDTLYGKIEAVTTHSYNELKARFLEIRNIEIGTYKNPIPVTSLFMDPYRDGRAIERFRNLLIS